MMNSGTLKTLLICLITISPLPSCVRAQVAGLDSSGAVVIDRKTSSLVDEGFIILKRGKSLNKAITLLEEATRREPQNPQILSYLGAAYAGQAYILSNYIYEKRNFADLERGYQILVEEIKSAQAYKGESALNMPFPSAPREPKLPFPITSGVASPTEQELIRQIAHLCELSLRRLTEANQAIQRIKKEQDFVTLSNLQGWSALLLAMEPVPLVAKLEIEDKKPNPDATYVKVTALLKKALEEANVANPTPIQNRITGDAFVIAANYPKLSGHAIPGTIDDTLLKMGLELIASGAGQSKDRAATWYWIAINQKEMTSEQTILALQMAAKYDRTNALYDYAYAAARVGIAISSEKKSTVIEDAFLSIRTGNAKPSLKPVAYSIAVPTPLRWAFVNYPLNDLTTSTALSLLFENYCDEQLRSGKPEDAFQRTKEWSEYGLKFYRAALDESFTQTERERCQATGRLLLAGVGGFIGRAKLGGTLSANLGELEYTLNFAPPPMKRLLREKGMLHDSLP
jgi:hypothetical protein